MKKTIEINGQSMEFEASAMTDHMADKVFGINLAYAFQHTTEDKYPDLVRKVSFIMNKRAELGGWRKVEELTQDDYFDWLDSIDSYALENSAKEIMNLYASNKENHVFPKNVTNPQQES